jgi:hypothetical protein
VKKTICHLDLHQDTTAKAFNRTVVVMKNLVVQVNFTAARSAFHDHFLSSSLYYSEHQIVHVGHQEQAMKTISRCQ